MASQQSLKLALFVVITIVILNFYASPTCAHNNNNISVHVTTAADPPLGNTCSRTCESKYCEVPPFMRYGKYCGIFYSGCPGERPCDGLDSCCMLHDQCIQAKHNDYLSESCNSSLVKCVNLFKKSKAPNFKGSTCNVDDIVKLIENVLNAAVVAGEILGRH